MRCRLVALTLIATQHVTLDIRKYVRPPIVARDQFKRSVFARVYSCQRVVTGPDDVVVQRGTVRDVELAFVVQQAFVLFSFESTVLEQVRALSAESL